MRNLRPFTLLEVVVAVMVLGLSLVMIMSILGAARGRVIRAERRWAREHLVTQATEFFLLAGPDAAVPRGIFPEGVTADCAVEDVDDLPDEARLPIGNMMLRTYRITVYGTAGEPLGERTVEKIVYEAP